MEDLYSIANVLSQPPFHKQITAYSLHDDYTFEQVLQLLSDVCVQLTEGTHLSSKPIDIRQEDPLITQQRIGTILSLLKYPSVYSSTSTHH
jgi:hypothetical protein